MATLSTKEYAAKRGITQRAVQKSIKAYHDSKDKTISNALVGVESIEKVGEVSQLVMKKNYQRTIDAYNKKKEKA